MADVLTATQRRFNMSRIRGRDTKPEMMIRRGLHARGFRYRLHNRNLPGKPDMVFPRYHVVILVHGCFWHGHNCPLFKLPATRQEFWSAKIAANRSRDERVMAELLKLGWRIATVWECSIKGPARLPDHEVFDRCQVFLESPEHRSMDIACSAI